MELYLIIPSKVHVLFKPRNFNGDCINLNPVLNMFTLYCGNNTKVITFVSLLFKMNLKKAGEDPAILKNGGFQLPQHHKTLS